MGKGRKMPKGKKTKSQSKGPKYDANGSYC